jgi:TRAP-type uncharacterized transport system fused permease subunit
VALAALAASSIAKASDQKIGWKATQIAVAGYVVPFMAVYDPALMLLGSWADAVYVTAKALIAVGLWGAAMVGYFWAPIGKLERAAAVIAASLLVSALPLTDAIGFVLAAALFAFHASRVRQDPTT